MSSKKKLNNSWYGLMGLLLVLTSYSQTDLGVYGNTFPIEEVDLRQIIQQQLNAIDWSSVQEKWLKKISAQLAHLPSSSLVLTAKSARERARTRASSCGSHCRYIDPSVQLQNGKCINPLHYVTPHTALLFIDGRDASQRALAYRLKQDSRHPVKVVLAKGNPWAFEARLRKEHRPFFQAYYAFPALVRRFHISALPSLLYANPPLHPDVLILLHFCYPYRFVWREEATLCPT